MVAVADDERERRPERRGRGGGRRAPRPRPARSAAAGCGRSPRCRRARSASIASRSRRRPAGSPVTIATSAGPCDSPAVARVERHAGQAYGGSHRRRPARGPPRPELERRRTLRDEHLEAGDDARAGGAGGAGGRRLRVREVDQRLPAAELDEHLVAVGGRVDDEVGAVDVGRPLAAAREARGVRERVEERDRRAAVAEDDRAARRAARRESRRRCSRPRCGRRGRRACSPTARPSRRARRRRACAASSRSRRRSRARRGREPRRRAARAGSGSGTYAQSSPSAAKAAFCIRGDSECSTGQPRSPTSRVAPLISRTAASIARQRPQPPPGALPCPCGHGYRGSAHAWEHAERHRRCVAATSRPARVTLSNRR